MSRRVNMSWTILSHAFPVQLFELYQDEKHNTLSRPVYDAGNNPVLNQEAVEMRDALIAQLAGCASGTGSDSASL